jgi:heme/copper-type cytochrome/quinol oxidase subunit 4
MIGNNSASPRNAWLLLLIISALSFGAAEFMAERHVAIAAIVSIAAAKIILILLRFMDIDRAPTGIRRYMYAWTVAVSALIFALWWGSVS